MLAAVRVKTGHSQTRIFDAQHLKGLGAAVNELVHAFRRYQLASAAQRNMAGQEEHAQVKYLEHRQGVLGVGEVF